MDSLQRLSIVTFSAGLVLLSPAKLFSRAQQTPGAAAEPKPAATEPSATLRSVSEEVYLDMVARDRHGKTVRDLLPEQVEVYEDGARQKVLSFRFVEGQPASEVNQPVGSQSDLLRGIALVSLVFERLGAQGRTNAREAALAFLRSELAPNVYVAVFSSDQRLYVIQPFTRDRDELTRAVERATGASSTEIASHSLSIQNQLEVAEGSYHTYSQALSQALASMNPTVSKVSLAIQTLFAGITWEALRFSDQLQQGFEGRSSLYSLIALIQAERRLGGRKTIIYFCEGLHLTPTLMDLFRSTVSEANRANVSIYSVDARGLDPTIASGNSHIVMAGAESATQGEVWPGRDEAGTAKTFTAGNLDFEIKARANVQDSLAELSRDTGGFLTANTNELDAAMRRIGDDVLSYYAVTYRPPARGYDGKFHRISVKVVRSGVALQTRSGYFAFPPIGGGPVLAYEAPMLAALSRQPPADDFPCRAEAFHFGSSKDGVEYQLVMEVPAADFSTPRVGDTEKTQAHFSLLALVRAQDGRVVQRFSQDFPMEIPDKRLEAFRRSNIVFRRNLRLPEGLYSLESAVFDQLTKKSSVHRSVLVVAAPPDGISLSSLAVIERLEPLDGAEDPKEPLHLGHDRIVPNLGAKLPPGAGGELPLYFEVYPSPSEPQKPRAELQFLRGGQLVAESPLELSAPDTSGKITFAGTIPTGKLQPGRYEIRALVRQGTSAAEEFGFFSIQP